VCGLTFAAITLAQHPGVSECFKVHELLRADEEHYWATWTNTCPYTIDSVYVTVRFADRSSRELADGVWSLHFIPPGTHRTMRLSAPGKVSDFASVHQKKITADLGEAFGRDMTPARSSPAEIAGAAAIVMDSGEAGYHQQTILTEMLSALLIARPAIVGDQGEAMFRTDFPDPWQAVLSPQESSVSTAPHGSFVRFVPDDKPIFQ
jgi:hypothetical protein